MKRNNSYLLGNTFAKGNVPNKTSWKKGYLIHHKDENAMNDTIENLEMLTKREHILAHHDMLHSLNKGEN